MVTWTQRNRNTPGWYWMLSPGEVTTYRRLYKSCSIRENRRWLTLIPACHYPKTSGKEFELQQVDAVWAGPLEVPSVLDQPTGEMVSLESSHQQVS